MEVDDLLDRWVAAEVAGDTATLAAIADPEFRLVGPFGFILTRDQWVARYDEGDLVTSELELTDRDAREHGDVAVVISVFTQKAAYRDQPNNGSFRATHLLRRGDTDSSWRLIGVHLSPLGLPQPPQS